MSEIWRSIKNYEDLYEISNYGNVKSLARAWTVGNGSKISHKEIFMKLRNHNSGYYAVTLFKNGKGIDYLVHHLIWDAFGNGLRDGKKLQIDHIDNNKLNNHIDNLQLLTQKENLTKHYLSKNRGLPIGVYKTGRKFKASIWQKSKRNHLGTFNCPTVAHFAYLLKLKQIQGVNHV